MVRQQIDVDGYWKVIVYYDVDFSLLFPVLRELRRIGFPIEDIREIFKQLSRDSAKAVTCSNGAKHTSIVLLNPHSSKADYLNSIVHEAEHIKQAMLNTYMIEDKGEPPAYTIGYLVMRMYEVFKSILYN
jgi:DNA-binding transcriptional MerR regulator